jgi:hypothetical protein
MERTPAGAASARDLSAEDQVQTRCAPDAGRPRIIGVSADDQKLARSPIDAWFNCAKL